MTAEIAILNSNAVALAADSAVTSGIKGQQKVFNSANKLFSLSKYHPVGIMVSGNANFMSIPWETVIKMYRAHLGDRSFPTLKGYADDFVQFLGSNRSLIPNSTQQRYVELVARVYFDGLLKKILQRIKEVFVNTGSVPMAEILRITNEIVEKDYADRAAAPVLRTKRSCTRKEVRKRYGPVIKRARLKAFGKWKLHGGTAGRLEAIIVLVLTRNLWPDGTSGIVIAGFGNKEVFPSVRWIDQVEAVICGRLKHSGIREASIGPKNSAAIIPFAQREMVATFMNGIDPNYAGYLDGFISKMLSQYSEAIVETIKPARSSERTVLLEMFRKVSSGLFAKFQKEIGEYSRSNHWGPIVDVVGALPKDELAGMAEALVNLTSFKRRISMDAETVGGPIDVAVISKGDGFIWIKRKHYFRPELNAHFAANYFRGSNYAKKRR